MTAFGGNPDYTLIHGGLDGRKKLAGANRAYCEKNKGVSPADRWYGMLRDDAAPMGRWQEAAYKLIQPVDPDRPPGKPGDATLRRGCPPRSSRSERLRVAGQRPRWTWRGSIENLGRARLFRWTRRATSRSACIAGTRRRPSVPWRR